MRSYINLLKLHAAVLLSILMFASCMKEEIVAPAEMIDERTVTSTTSTTSKSPIYGLSTNNEIIRFAAGPPVTELGVLPIKGLKIGEKIVAIDIRPATRQLYAVSNQGYLYVINVSTGVVTPLSKTAFSPALSGTTVGFDFNPAYDRIRIVTDADQNVTVNPVTGRVELVEMNLSPAGLNVNSIAYATGTAKGTSLYDISTTDGSLYNQYDGKGNMIRIGDTGLNIKGEGGFDISRDNVRAFAVLLASSKAVNPGGVSDPKTDDLSVEANRLYSIDRATGVATSLGRVRPLIGIAIP